MRYDFDDDAPRKSSLKYTVIDDDILTNTIYEQQVNAYNSNSTTGVFADKVKRSNYIPKDYLENLKSNYPPVNPPRKVSFEEEAMRERETVPVVGKVVYPPTNYAGVSPPMQNTSSDSGKVQMVEGFSNDVYVPQQQTYQNYPPRQSQQPTQLNVDVIGGQTCMDTLMHVQNCPLCSNYFKCDTKFYNVIILTLIIIFAIITFFMYREDERRQK